MRRALAGDQQAYAQLLRNTAALLRPFLARRLANAGDVDDLLQEVLISLHKARHTYDSERPYKPWVYAIARFRLLDHLRSCRADHLRGALDISDVEHSLGADVTEPALDYESIANEVGRLPDKQAAILRLMHREGFTAGEVAQRLGMSESAVKVAAHRAYKILRKRLER